MLPPQDYDLAAEVEKHDVLLSYPYQSIRPFIAMLKKAAQDPRRHLHQDDALPHGP